MPCVYTVVCQNLFETSPHCPQQMTRKNENKNIKIYCYLQFFATISWTLHSVPFPQKPG
jgi:hypothetical protein